MKKTLMRLRKWLNKKFNVYVPEAIKFFSTTISRDISNSDDELGIKTEESTDKDSEEYICDKNNPLFHPYRTYFYPYIVTQLKEFRWIPESNELTDDHRELIRLKLLSFLKDVHKVYVSLDQYQEDFISKLIEKLKRTDANVLKIIGNTNEFIKWK